jgi:hypothetical protein
VNEVTVDSILHERRRVRAAEEAVIVRFIVGEQERRRSLRPEEVAPGVRMDHLHRAVGVLPNGKLGLPARPVPRPRIPKPDRGEEIERGGVGAPIRHRDPNQDVFDVRFRVLHQDVEIPIPLEDAGVEQLELGVVPAPPPGFLGERRVGEGAVGIFI